MSLYCAIKSSVPSNFFENLPTYAAGMGCIWADGVWTFPSGQTIPLAIDAGTTTIQKFLLSVNTKPGNEALVYIRSASSASYMLSSYSVVIIAGITSDGLRAIKTTTVMSSFAYCNNTDGFKLSNEITIYPCISPKEATMFKNIFFGYGSAIFKTIVECDGLKVVEIANTSTSSSNDNIFFLYDDEMFD